MSLKFLCEGGRQGGREGGRDGGRGREEREGGGRYYYIKPWLSSCSGKREIGHKGGRGGEGGKEGEIAGGREEGSRRRKGGRKDKREGRRRREGGGEKEESRGAVSLYQAKLLTDERKEDRVVVGHDKEGDVGEAATGLEVAKWMHQPLLLPTALNKHLWMGTRL